jgi:mRNA interferase MazF
VANEYSPVVIVTAVTTALGPKECPTEVRVLPPEGGLKKDSTVLLNQIRTIDKRRMIEHWGSLGPQTMKRLDEALKISLGLVPI